MDDIGARVERKPQEIFVTVCCSICYDSYRFMTATKILKLKPHNITALQMLLFLLSFKENICIAEIGKQEVVIADGFQNRYPKDCLIWSCGSFLYQARFTTLNGIICSHSDRWRCLKNRTLVCCACTQIQDAVIFEKNTNSYYYFRLNLSAFVKSYGLINLQI